MSENKKKKLFITLFIVVSLMTASLAGYGAYEFINMMQDKQNKKCWDRGGTVIPMEYRSDICIYRPPV